MPRRDDDSDDDPQRRPMANESNPYTWIAVLVGVGGLLAFGVIFLIGIGANPFAATPKVWTRDEFQTAVLGKSSEQVIASVGRPETAHDHPNGKPDRWVYPRKVLNPTTQRPDDVWVEFDEFGKASKVIW